MFERKSHEIKEGYNKEVLLEVLRNFDNSGESVNEERNRIKRFKIEHNGKEKEEGKVDVPRCIHHPFRPHHPHGPGDARRPAGPWAACP